jgi:hypothetical protein
MSITTLDQFIAALTASTKKKIDTYKANANAEAAGAFHSLWLHGGNYPGPGVTPPAYDAGSGYIPTAATAGALPITNAGGSNTLYVGQAVASSTFPGRLAIYDRLWHCSGLVTNNAAPYTLTITTPGNVNRGTANGVGVEAWFEVYTAPGATGATWTFNFTDPADAAKTGTYTHPANAETAGQLLPITLAGGVTGVKSPTSVTFSAASGTAGDIGITLMRKIVDIPFVLPNVLTLLNFADLGLPKIEADACLALMVLCTTTSTGNIHSSIQTVEG